jgi:hypothetical protein
LVFKKIIDTEGEYYSVGKDLIQINPKRTARSGIVLIKNSWIKEVATLIKETNVLKNTYFSSTFRALWYLDLPHYNQTKASKKSINPKRKR